MERKPIITSASLHVPQDTPADEWLWLEDMGDGVDIFLGSSEFLGGRFRVTVDSVEAVEAAALRLANEANLIRRARRDAA